MNSRKNSLFPSKKILIPLCVVLAMAVIVISLVKTRSVTEVKKSNTPLSLTAFANQDADVDADGLKDWEEALWGTDPKTADSDGDDTKDGDEVKIGRDPRIKGPNDKVEDTVAAVTNEATNLGNVGTLNTTQRFGRSIFAKYMALKQGGNDLTPQQEEALLSEAINELSLTIEYKTYASKDVKTIEDTPANIKAYADSLRAIAQKYSPKQGENELAILNNSLENGENDEDATKLKNIADGYKKTLTAYAALKVPRSAASYHLALLNSVSKVGTNIEGFSRINTDSVFVLANVTPYSTNIEALAKAIDDLRNYFLAAKVNF